MTSQADFEHEAQDRVRSAGVPTDADKPDDHEPAAEPDEAVNPDADPHVDRQLDKGLKETFPASDPVSINPGAD